MIQNSPAFNIIQKSILWIISVILVFNLFGITVFSQTSVNAINLTIPKVTKSGNTELAQNVGQNTWQYDGELTLDDEIRYGWNAVSLDLACKAAPITACGYIKVYLNDTTSEQNLITETGSSPLPVEQLAPKLVEGPTKIVLVYIDSQNPTDVSTQVAFTFNFKNTTTRPQISVIEPTQDALLGRGITRDFRLELTNFDLESTNSGLPNRGKLNVYTDTVAPANLLGTLSTSTSTDTGVSVVTFDSDDIDFSLIPDSLGSKIVFALTKTDGELLNVNAELMVRTNYEGSLDVGLPKVTITEPRKDRSTKEVDSNQKFIVQIDNFEILPEFQAGGVEEGKGYLQILIDDAPIKTTWPKNNFSLAEIQVEDMDEGPKTIKVQLVNKDFSKLVPEAVDSIEVLYIPSLVEGEQDGATQVQSNLWRIIMVILIVVLVIGGIAVLITKG